MIVFTYLIEFVFVQFCLYLNTYPLKTPSHLVWQNKKGVRNKNQNQYPGFCGKSVEVLSICVSGIGLNM